MAPIHLGVGMQSIDQQNTTVLDDISNAIANAHTRVQNLSDDKYNLPIAISNVMRNSSIPELTNSSDEVKGC